MIPSRSTLTVLGLAVVLTHTAQAQTTQETQAETPAPVQRPQYKFLRHAEDWSDLRDLSRLADYCRVASQCIGIPLPTNYPVFGTDAFETSTGVHAAAIIKAEAKGDAWLADRVYSSVPASLVGRQQEIEIGPMSGLSNVKHWLRSHGHDAQNEALCRAVFDAAKASDHTLSTEEIEALIGTIGSAASAEG